MMGPTELHAFLEMHPSWEHHPERAAIVRTVQLVDFPAAMAFMTEVAFHAEAMHHHPEWSNVYNRVTIALTTHDAGGITSLDLDLAKAIDRIVERTSPRATDHPSA